MMIIVKTKRKNANVTKYRNYYSYQSMNIRAYLWSGSRICQMERKRASPATRQATMLHSFQGTTCVYTRERENHFTIHQSTWPF
jgi:hypothetical protein